MVKYKPWKLSFILLFIVLLDVISSIIAYKTDNLFACIVLIVLGVIILSGLFISIFYFTKIYKDKIVFRQGYFIAKLGENPYKRKESWISIFLTTTIYYSDIKETKKSPDNIQWLIIFNNGERMVISFSGYSKTIQNHIYSMLSSSRQ